VKVRRTALLLFFAVAALLAVGVPSYAASAQTAHPAHVAASAAVAPAVASALPVVKAAANHVVKAVRAAHKRVSGYLVSRRTCASGNVGDNYQWQAPGDVAVWWATASSPSGCAVLCPEAISNQGFTFWGGPIKNTGITSVAQDASGSTGLLKGYIWKHINGSWSRKELYPSPGGWVVKSSTPTC
jgi:hypothetical protein